MADLLAKGSVVLSFYRGGWCPYCRHELQAFQTVLPRVIELGADLVAISPDSPDESLSTATQNGLSFALLSDFDSAIAKSCGIAFEVPEESRPVYARAIHPLPAGNGDGTRILPIPATYVVGRDGIIALAFLDVDYRNRLEPSDVLTALRALSQER